MSGKSLEVVHEKPKRSGKGRADYIDQLVSKRLKLRRMMMGYSQNDLSNAANVSIQQVQKYENATNRISSGKLFHFSEYLKVPISYFFNNNEEEFLNVLSEDGISYGSSPENNITEKEVISLVKAFSEVQDPKVRKKVIDLIKSMA